MTADQISEALDYARRVEASRLPLPTAPKASGNPSLDRAAMLDWLSANRAAGVGLFGCPPGQSALKKPLEAAR